MSTRADTSAPSPHFADRLLHACQVKGSPICVGIDPVLERLPRELRPAAHCRDIAQQVQAMVDFVLGIFDVIADLVPCVKIQSACFERYLWPGVKAYHQLVHQARVKGLIVIGDAKRGDIGISSQHYAVGCLADHPLDQTHLCENTTWLQGQKQLLGPDALTVNAYLGADGLAPFAQLAAEQDKGLFALVRTSNPGGDALQSLRLADGGYVADAVAKIVSEMDVPIGESGYSLIGAVVGATKSDDARRLRQLMPRQIFLVPGFGAQGAGADDVRACFNDDKQGAVITASRSVLYAFEKTDLPWQQAIEQAAMKMKQQICEILH